jgi:hypothetical protein
VFLLLFFLSLSPLSSFRILPSHDYHDDVFHTRVCNCFVDIYVCVCPTSGSFQGATLYENPDFVSPNLIRSNAKKAKSFKYTNKVDSKDWHKVKVQESELPVDPVDAVFKRDDSDE